MKNLKQIYLLLFFFFFYQKKKKISFTPDNKLVSVVYTSLQAREREENKTEGLRKRTQT